MFAASARKIGFIVFLISSVSCLRSYGDSGGSLYVANEPDNSPKPILINRVSEEKDGSSLERNKRDAPTLPTPALQNNISAWTTHLNDSHQQLMVHWVGEGSNVIICLARDSSPRNKGANSSSALFISYDYGKNFTNKTESFKLGKTPESGYAQLDKFFNHPKYPQYEYHKKRINGIGSVVLEIAVPANFVPPNSRFFIFFKYLLILLFGTPGQLQ